MGRDTGMPSCAAPVMTMAAPVSAAKPWTGSSFVILTPSVRTTRQPPTIVPSAHDGAAETMTQIGMLNSSGRPAGAGVEEQEPA